MESDRKQSWHSQAVTLLEGPDVLNQGSLWLLMRKKQNRALVRLKGFGKHTCVMALTAFDGYQMANRKRGGWSRGAGNGKEAGGGRGLERSFVRLCKETTGVKGVTIYRYVCIGRSIKYFYCPLGHLDTSLLLTMHNSEMIDDIVTVSSSSAWVCSSSSFLEEGETLQFQPG